MTYFMVQKFYLFKSGYFCHYDLWFVTALEVLSKGMQWTCGPGTQPDSSRGIKIYLICRYVVDVHIPHRTDDFFTFLKLLLLFHFLEPLENLCFIGQALP